jgi:hypothetical protein
MHDHDILDANWKGRVRYLNDLYVKFPDGGETHWYAYVTTEKDFAEWDTPTRQWVLRGTSKTNGYVKYSEKQSLSEAEQKQARENIDAASSGEFESAEEEITALNNRITELTSIVNAYSGKGGGVGHSDFGATPTQEQLTKCAVGVIWTGYTDWVWNATDPASSTFKDADGEDHTVEEVFNGTFVINDYDNHKWVLCNTPSTTPPVYQWIDMGVDSVGTATNTKLGIVKGSTKEGEVSINPDGTMTVNGYSTEMPIGIPFYSLRYKIPDNCRDMTLDNRLSMDAFAKCYEELGGDDMLWEKDFTTRTFKLPKIPAGGSLIAAGTAATRTVFEFGTTVGSDMHTNTSEEMFPHDHYVASDGDDGGWATDNKDKPISSFNNNTSGTNEYMYHLRAVNGDQVANTGKSSNEGGILQNNAKVSKPYSIMNPGLVCRILIRVS